MLPAITGFFLPPPLRGFCWPLPSRSDVVDVRSFPASPPFLSPIQRRGSSVLTRSTWFFFFLFVIPERFSGISISPQVQRRTMSGEAAKQPSSPPAAADPPPAPGTPSSPAELLTPADPATPSAAAAAAAAASPAAAAAATPASGAIQTPPPAAQTPPHQFHGGAALEADVSSHMRLKK